MHTEDRKRCVGSVTTLTSIAGGKPDWIQRVPQPQRHLFHHSANRGPRVYSAAELNQKKEAGKDTRHFATALTSDGLVSLFGRQIFLLAPQISPAAVARIFHVRHAWFCFFYLEC